MHSHSPSSPSASPPHPLSPSTPPLCQCVGHHHGERQDGNAGARKKGDGYGEGQEDESGVIVKVRAAAELDSGRLDPIYALARGSGRSGRHWFDRCWGCEATEGEIEPQPRSGECVLLATHVDRGFYLPPRPFFQGFLNFFSAQLHHFSPNTIT